MDLENYAVQVKAILQRDYGDISDLSPELINTLCNLYYFHIRAERGEYNLEELQSLTPSGDETHMARTSAEHLNLIEFATTNGPELVAQIRSARRDRPEIGDLLEKVTLDVLKYRIDDAQNKSGIRRHFERKFKRPIEYPDLSQHFGVHPCRDSHAP